MACLLAVVAGMRRPLRSGGSVAVEGFDEGADGLGG